MPELPEEKATRSTPTDPGPSDSQPGPIYDRAARAMAHSDPPTVSRLLELPAAEVIMEPAALSNTALTADLVMRIGPHRLANVEYVTTVPTGLITQLLGYRFAIMRDHPRDELSQHVIVLGDGTVRGHDRPGERHFSLELQVVYVREIPPRAFLADPQLAPLAALGRGGTRERADALAEALTLIHDSGVEHAGLLATTAATLAAIRLDTGIIEKIVKEVEMSAKSAEEIFQLWRAVGWADPFLAQGRQEGVVQGRQEGVVQGRQEGVVQGRQEGVTQAREELFAELIEQRFGADPAIPALARGLAGWPQTLALHTITGARSLDDVMNAVESNSRP